MSLSVPGKPCITFPIVVSALLRFTSLWSNPSIVIARYPAFIIGTSYAPRQQQQNGLLVVQIRLSCLLNMSSKSNIISSFIEDAPPGEVPHHVIQKWLAHLANRKPSVDRRRQGYAFSRLRVEQPYQRNCLPIDIKNLTSDQPNLLQSQDAAFKKYNEAQFSTVKLPGGSQQV